MVTTAVSKKTAELKSIVNEKFAASMPATLKNSSGTAWIRDKSIYHQWQTWSKKARHAVDAMDGDSEKATISYFHHWIDSTGEAQIESWINNGTLLKEEDYNKLNEDQKKGKCSQSCTESYFTLFELMLAPKSNPLLAIKELYKIKQGSMNTGESHASITKVAKRCKFSSAEGCVIPGNE